MRNPVIILLALLTWLPFSTAQGSALLAAIDKLPQCALICLTGAIADSPCQLTDAKCICTNAPLQSSVEACVLKSCTVKQALTTKNITMTTCNAPIRDRSSEGKLVNITLGVISACCVLLRIVYKLLVTRQELGWDDIFIVITLIVGIPQTILTDRGTLANGMGRDIWTLPFDQITDFVRYFYVMEILYFLIVAVLKLSYLFFYQRIFPGRPVRRVILATIIFDVLFGVAFVIAGIFQCRPISFYWTNWDGEHKGKCIDINALGWANAAISITLDFWMLAIPLSQLLHLKLAWKKKIGVAMMFCVGTFVTVVSIIRLQSLVHFAKSINATWDQWEVSNWSTIEINVGIICACMPAIRVVLVRLFPKVLGTTQNTNQYYAKYGSNSRAMGHGAVASANNNASHNSVPPRNKNAITFTKTFEVQHADKVDDEVGLVELDDFGAKGKSARNSSEASM
ncbi:hypothetical protein EJ04DRAFT_545296 [Polyplosphaeria fusca]|uniref:CFEM domain-containing protein n=1 Tax=Polyplosphaeria fusca TaxID=682080 RepID=A0A9P4UZS7_9PLEO|nr:hypothetical protein EJ04DRAFT_545296 [Polyplosphaeria fusca]